MKKNGLIGIGLVVLVGVGILVTKERAKVEKPKAERVEKTPVVNPTVSSLSASVTKLQSPQIKPVVQAETPVKDQKVSWNPEELSEAVRTLAGLDGKDYTYAEMLSAVRALGTNLNAEEVAALRAMLWLPIERFPKMRPIDANSVKNDVLEALIRQVKLPEGLGLQVVDMLNDPASDAVWKEYCVQFLQPLYERQIKEDKGNLDAENVKLAEADLSAITNALFGALSLRGGEAMAGTALIGLEELSKQVTTIDRSKILEKALEMAADESLDAASRLTALRMAAGNVKPDAGHATVSQEAIINIARLLVQTGETDMLRGGAMMTLGELGSPNDRMLLESFTQNRNRQLAAAAKMALAVFDKR